MSKVVDFTKNVNALCEEYPELVDVLVGLGFKPLADPEMRRTAGSVMTLKNGAEMIGVDCGRIVSTLEANGFSVVGTDECGHDGRFSCDVCGAEEVRPASHEAGHTFLAHLGKTRLRPCGLDATEWLLRQVSITPKTKLLEVACNMGTTLVQVAERYGCAPTGLDLDAKALANARKNVEKHGLSDRVTLVQGSAFELPFEDNSFDVVINEAMLTMQTGDKKDKCLAEYARVLKPGGVLLTQDVALAVSDEAEKKSLRAGLSRTIQVNVEPLTVEGWEEKFREAGFIVKQQNGPMTLMDPKGLVYDEGEEGAKRIFENAKKPENAERFNTMFRFFNDNADKLRYIAAASTKA